MRSDNLKVAYGALTARAPTEASQRGSGPPATMRKTVFSSSTGTKILIALTGLGLFAYLIVHLAGNLLFFAGPRTFNHYSHALISNPLIYVMEVGLGGIFLVHLYKAARNFLLNRAARPAPYHKKEWAGKPSRKTLASSTMIGSGIITVAFIIVHLVGIKFGAHYEEADSHGVRDLYRTQVEHFSNPLTLGFYLVALLVIGFHTWHGFWSAFQSLGFGNSRYTPKIAALGKALTGIIIGGFIFIAFWVHFTARP